MNRKWKFIGNIFSGAIISVHYGCIVVQANARKRIFFYGIEGYFHHQDPAVSGSMVIFKQSVPDVLKKSKNYYCDKENAHHYRSHRL